MRGLRFDRLMSSAALALPLSVVLAIPLSYAQTDTQAPAAVENAVPMPETATLAPPTASDIAAPSGTEGVGTPTEPPATENATAAPTQAPAEPATAPTGTTTAPAPAEPVRAPAATTAAPVEAVAAPAETATAPAEAVDPLASLDPADRPIAEAIRNLLPKSDRTFSSRKERQVIEAFYQGRNYAPIWFERGTANTRAQGVSARIQSSLADGLVPTEYKLPDLAAGSADAQAEAELRLTATLITFTRHLQAGRFPYARMGTEILLPQQPPEVPATLAKMTEASDAAAAIDEFSPPQPGYRALKAKLAALRGATGEEAKVVRIPEGPMLRPGMEDARVPLLRERLNVEGDETNLRYEEPLVTAVKAYQKSNRMNADGMVGSATVRSLNAASSPRRTDVIDTIIANMERWRWIPRELGDAHVMLNIPNYTLRVMQNGKEIWQTRVVVGKPSTATPLLTETMKFITVNPTWNVPPSIVRNEYLPALARDPGVLARMGLRVSHNRDGSVHVSQPPGDNNALGRIRFNFPNRFLVYQHDTPDKNLFSHDRRAYSHGCMRVQDPLKYGEVLLSIARPGEGYSAQRLRSMYGPAEVNIQFPAPIPVHITYQTAFIDDAGELQVRPDIYGIDTKTKNLIRSERGVVEPIPDRPANVASTTPVKRARPTNQQTSSGGGFFEQLFGGGQTAAPPAAKGRPQRGQPKNQARSNAPLWGPFGAN